MRKIIIREWPFPEKTKAMLLRVENPVYAGNGNWHTDVTFRSINKEDRKVKLDWGLLPMLKTGQIFSDGAKLYDKKNTKTAVFTFDNVEFEFFIDRIITASGTVQRPAFRAKIGETYYFIPAIEAVRSFFARTRRLAYSLLEANSILPLCQCQINSYPTKHVIVNLSPDCPAELASEQWISTLVWMATDPLAQKSWSSFFLYFKACQGLNVFFEKEEEIPVFPLHGKYSLTCGYRTYGKNVWLDEIFKLDCDSLDFDEIIVRKYITERSSGIKSKIISVRQSEQIEIVNSAQSALNRNVIADVDLPSLMFKKQPRISIIKKSTGAGLGGYKCIEKVDGSIAVTGKNDGFTDARTGIEFSLIDKNTLIEKYDDDLLKILNLKEARSEYLQYNQCLIGYLDVMRIISRMTEIVGAGTKLYELPGDTSFAWITPNIKRCCAISIVKLSTGKEIHIIEVDRTIFGSERRCHVATLILIIKDYNSADILTVLAHILAETGHWTDARLSDIGFIMYERLRHGNDDNRQRWASRMWDIVVNL